MIGLTRFWLIPCMGGSTVGHGGACNVKSLIFTIGAPPPIYNLRLLCPPPDLMPSPANDTMDIQIITVTE